MCLGRVEPRSLVVCTVFSGVLGRVSGIELVVLVMFLTARCAEVPTLYSHKSTPPSTGRKAPDNAFSERAAEA